MRGRLHPSWRETEKINVKKSMAIAGVVLLAAGLVTGCTANTPLAIQSGSSSAAPRGTSGAGTHPAFRAQDLLDIYAAVTEITYECYASHGYPQFKQVLPEQRRNLFRSLPSTPDYVTAFAKLKKVPWFESEEDARLSGYGQGFPAVVTSVYAMDVAFRDVARTCAAQANEQIPGSQEFVASYSGLGATLADALKSVTDRDWDAVTENIFTCMAKNGFPVSSTGDNVSPKWTVDFGVLLGKQPTPEFPQIAEGAKIQIVPTMPAKGYFPTPEESESAAVMHRCSVETGARGAWEDAISAVEFETVSINESKLTKLNAKIPALLAAASRMH